MTEGDIEQLTVEADWEIERFVKDFVKRFRSIFKDGTYICEKSARGIPEDFFPYDVLLRIKIST